MTEHIYKVIELVGTSTKSWEDAVAKVVQETSRHLQDLRIGEVEKFDVQIDDGRIVSYRVKLKVSFKYHPELHEKH